MTIDILPPPTQAEADKEWLESLIIRKAEAMHHFAVVSDAVSKEFWGEDPERIARVLNSNIERSLAIMSNDEAVNNPINAGLDLLNLAKYPTRAPVTKGREDIVFDGTQFVFAKPVLSNPQSDNLL